MEKSKKTNSDSIIDSINEFKVDLWSHPKRDGAADTNCCEYCGKPLGKNPLYVHVNTDGTILPNSITEEDLVQVGMESQGAFPIGSNCAKKLFGSKLKLYTYKYENSETI